METIYKISGYVAVAVIAIVITLLLSGKVNAEEKNRYVVVLEENTTYKVLATEVMYNNKQDVVNMVDWYLNGSQHLANRLFITMLTDGRAIKVKHLNYLVVFVSLHKGYTIYKVVG